MGAKRDWLVFHRTVLSGASINVKTFAVAGPDENPYTSNQAGSSLHPFIDPLFTLEPAYADRFRLDGLIGETAAVPGTWTWGMMVGGVGMVRAVKGRQRKIKTVVQFA